MTDARQNWIGARWCSAASGDGFDLAPLADGSRALGRWPRSGRLDARAALAAAQSAQATWQQTAHSERVRLLRKAARALDSSPDPGGTIAARLTLAPDEFAPHVANLGDTLERAMPGERDDSTVRPQGRPRGVAVHAPHWSELVREPARRLFAALAAGETVVLLSDRRLPMAADAIATALAHADLPPGVWSLLHEDGATCLRDLLAHDDVGALCAAGPRVQMHRLARESLAGATRARSLELVPLSNTSHVIRLEDDPSAAAAHVIDAAFGRAHALSGQAPGQVGRVLCNERVFSRFSAELLSGLEHSPDVLHAVPLIDGEARQHASRARELGLDEGATLIHPRSLDLAAAQGESENATPATLVFTNVDPFLRLAGLSRPSPCLCLMRVVSDSAGAALALSFDQAVSVEDLSAQSGGAAGDFDALEADL